LKNINHVSGKGLKIIFSAKAKTNDGVRQKRTGNRELRRVNATKGCVRLMQANRFGTKSKNLFCRQRQERQVHIGQNRENLLAHVVYVTEEENKTKKKVKKHEHGGDNYHNNRVNNRANEKKKSTHDGVVFSLSGFSVDKGNCLGDVRQLQQKGLIDRQLFF
jgi:hypothetical protein